MGNRSKFIAMTAAGAALVAVRRRARLRQAAEGIGETILPSVQTEDLAASEVPAGDGHAPGHRHLPTDDPDRVRWGRLRRRPRALYGHKERYPYAKS